MTGGFGAVPEELYRTANQIGDVIGSASGLLWQGPSGDYGHPGVQTGWGSFIDDVKSEVEKLAKKAEGHGEELRTVAGKYAESDTQAGDAIGKLGAGLFDSLGGLQGAPGGGITGGLGGILDGAGQAGSGIGPLGETKIGAGLEGVLGGGFTGGATGKISGSVDGPTGVMSPERSKELFPGSSGGTQPDARGEGPVY
jgi:hypothetical protein